MSNCSVIAHTLLHKTVRPSEDHLNSHWCHGLAHSVYNVFTLALLADSSLQRLPSSSTSNLQMTVIVQCDCGQCAPI
jgi:hypothetical protein